MDVKAQVIERFVQVEYKIKAVLTGKKNKKHTFFVFIPDGAFMSGLVVKEANKVYKGIVVDRDEDKELIAEVSFLIFRARNFVTFNCSF